MLRKLLFAGSTLAALVVAPSAFAQAQITATPAQDAVKQASATAPGTNVENLPRPLRASQVIGSKVSVQDGTGVGTVSDIVLSEGGDVEYMIVSHDGQMKTVPWRAARYDEQKRSAVIQVTPQAYQQVPTYTQQQYPNFYNPDYRNRTYQQYNVEPQPLRRMLNNEVQKQLNRVNPGQPRPDR